MRRLSWYYLLPALVLLLPLWTWFELEPGDSRTAVAPPLLPQAEDVKTNGLLEAILAHNLWDEKRGQLVSDATQAAGAADKSASACQLKGIAYAQLQVPQAMFACDGKLTLLQEGAELPDHSLLREIHVDHAVLEKDGDIRKQYLFGKKQTLLTAEDAEGAEE